MSDLQRFWKFVWYRPGLDASGLEWRHCLGDDLWHALRDRFFICLGDARTCQNPTDGQTLIVMTSAKGNQLIGESTGHVALTNVPNADIRRYRIDQTALRNEVAGALGIIVEPSPVRETPRAFSLGQWQPTAGIFVPMHMILPPTAKVLHSELQRLLLEDRSGFIMFVPQVPKLERQDREQLQRGQSAVVCLQEMIGWNGERLVVAPAWDTYARAHLDRYFPDQFSHAQPAYQFARKGMWAIRFAGKETFLEGTLKGPIYIYYLLAHQGEKIHVARMLSDIVGDERLALATDSGLAISPEELSCLKQRYNDLQTEKDQAVNWHDDGRLAAIEREMDQITSYIAPLLGLAGRSRKANDDVARIRRSIARVIGIAVEKITQNDPALGHHLSQSIKTHSYMSYEPEQRIEWNFE